MSYHVVILTGAGVSAESGVPTFRDANGLWEGYRVEEVATPEAFQRHPDVVHRFYNLRRAALNAVQPNAAHRALARLQAEFPGQVTLITQNVDDLHERVGSDRVIHMHGQLREALCASCGEVAPWEGDLSEMERCPHCRRVGHLRPNIVWFGEMPHHMDEIYSALKQANVFAAIGTSGQVYPAAGFVRQVDPSAMTVELNHQSTLISGNFNRHRLGPATVTVPEWVDCLLSGVL